MTTFAEKYCSRYDATTETYVDAMFWRCLHRRAWLLVPFIKLVCPEFFTADYDLIRDVGRLTRATGLTEDLADFHSHPYNRGFARRTLRLRVSVRRVTKEVHRLLPGRAPAEFYDTAKPFPGESAGGERGAGSPPHSASS